MSDINEKITEIRERAANGEDVQVLLQELTDMLGGVFKDKMHLHGSLTLTLTKEDGSIETRHKDNLVVDAGFDLIADAIGATASRPAIISHIAVGTGAVAPAAGDTTLGTELVRQAATYAHTAGTKVFTMTTTLAAGVGSGAITEAGVLNAATLGDLLDRVTFAVINKGAGDSLTAQFSFTMS